MFGLKLAGRPRSKPADRPAIPPGVIAHAVGDIHGRADLFIPLLTRILADAARAGGARNVVICLGDYVDRGPNSRGVIDALLMLRASARVETRFLLGNHESALLDFIVDPKLGAAWFALGGGETVASYGVVPRLAGVPTEVWPAIRDEFASALPRDHLDFLRGLEPAFELGDYFFAHAGARPGVSLRDQDRHDLLWIRQPFLQDRRLFEKVVVHGHTPAAEVHVDRRRIGLDTGAFATGVLSAIRLQDDRRRIMQARRGAGGLISIEAWEA
jgi:serine/threonine protein phosphatase 1